MLPFGTPAIHYCYSGCLSYSSVEKLNRTLATSPQMVTLTALWTIYNVYLLSTGS